MRRLGAAPKTRKPLRGNGFTAIASGGTGQTGVCGSALATAFSVTVKNASGALASGVTVLWDSTSDGTFSSSTSTTDGSGVASSTLTLGSVAGTQTATATVLGVGVITFSATATAVAVASVMSPNSTLDQSAATSSTVAAPPSVLVTDQFGNPFAGKTVTFAVTAGGGSRSPATVDTGADGIATLTSWTLGGSVGVNTLTASVSGLTGSPITFTASAVTATPTQIAVTAGGSQTGVVAGQAATAITFRVRDGSNNNLQGVAVAFSTNLGSLSASSGTTDASGLASVTLTTDTTVGTATVTGSVLAGTISTSTTVVSTFGTATKVLITTQAASNGSSGTALPGQPIIRITDANGNTVTSGASSTLTVTITIVSGNGAPTGNTQAAVAGVATFTAFAITDVDGGVNIPRYTATGLAGTADGDGITLAPPVPDHPGFGGTVSGAQVGQSIAAFTVEIRDSSNGVVPGATNAVTITLTGAPGVVLGGTTTVNAIAGIATFSGLTVDTAGSYTFTATSVGLATPTAVSNSFTISAAGSHPNLPIDVSWTVMVNPDLTLDALDTAYGVNTVKHGMTYQTGGGNMFTRSIANQASWRDADCAAIPTPPNGSDRVIQCRISAAQMATASEKGRAVFTPGSGTLALYIEWYGLITSNWVGNPAGSFKKYYVRTNTSAGGGLAAILYNGAGSATVQPAINYELFPSVKIAFSSMTRNTWYRFAVLVVAESAAGNNDGYVVFYRNDVEVHRKLNLDWHDTDFRTEQQWLNFLGGTGSTSVPGGFVAQSTLSTGLYFAKSTSRPAVPA